MKIAVFSMTPLFENQIMGGSQQILKDIVIHLGNLGHIVSVYATKRWDTKTTFKWHENVYVNSTFDFKQPYPDPYATKPYSIANAISEIGALIANSDRLYLHDSALPFPYVYKNIPTVGSLPDVVYSETLIGSFTFGGSNLIVPSEHTRDVYLNTVGRFFPELHSRLSVIHNGFDFDIFKETKAKELYDFIPKEVLDRKHVILHPHRPEPLKGLDTTIEIVAKLVEHGFRDLVVLVPLWIETDNNKDLQTYYLSKRKAIHNKGLDKYFYFHPWLSREVMPQYFSRGSVMFSFGSYVETFGNAVYEAIGCGTPVVVSNRGPHRATLPNEFAEKVEPNDIEEIVLKVKHILIKKKYFTDSQLDVYKEQFSIGKMVSSYADKIINAKIVDPMKYVSESINSSTPIKLSPWVITIKPDLYVNEFNITDKFDKKFVNFASKIGSGLTITNCIKLIKNCSIRSIHTYIKNGWIVPGGDNLR